MKQKLLRTLALALVVLGGVSAVWGQTYTPVAETLFRTNSGNTGWDSGYPKETSTGNAEYEIKYLQGFFALQKYTIPNLAAVKSLKLHIAGPSDKGTDALAIWAFGRNDWSTVSDVISDVTSKVGIAPRASSGTAGSPLVNTAGSDRETVDGVQYCRFTVSGDALAALKASATDNTFTLLITNATSALTTDTQRKYYSSGHTTTAYRPYVEVTETYPAAIGMTGYETLNAAYNAISTTGTIDLYDDITITGRCDSGSKTISVVPMKAGIKITSSLTNSLWFLTQSGATVSIGSDSYQLIIDGNNATNSSCFVEAGNSSVSTTINNVKFLNCNTSAASVTGSIICYKANGGSLKLKNVEFDGCTVSASGCGLVFYGLSDLHIEGGLTITNCTADCDIYIENNDLTDKILKVKDMNVKPSTPIRLSFKTPALKTIALSSDYVDKTSWFNIMNDSYGLAYQSSNADHLLTEAYTLNVTSAEASTLVLPFASKIPTGVTAYTLTYSSGDAVAASEVTGGTLATNTPVLINAAEGKYKFVNTALVESVTTGTGTHTSGALTGVYAETQPGTGHYILTNHSGAVGFRKTVASSKVAANRAYLTASSGEAPEFLFIDFSGDSQTTAIEKVENKASVTDGIYYTLSGQRVLNPTKGLYIVNGKKVVIK